MVVSGHILYMLYKDDFYTYGYKIKDKSYLKDFKIRNLIKKE